MIGIADGDHPIVLTRLRYASLTITSASNSPHATGRALRETWVLQEAERPPSRSVKVRDDKLVTLPEGSLHAKRHCQPP